MTLATRLSLSVVAELTTNTGFGTSKDPAVLDKMLTWLDGVDAGEADVIYAASRSVNASTTDSLDVATGGGLLNLRGAALALAKVKAIAMVNTHATQGLTIGRPAANGVPWLTAAGDSIPIPAGGFMGLAAGGTAGLASVTAGTGDLIDVTNGAGATGTYKIVIIGTSA